MRETALTPFGTEFTELDCASLDEAERARIVQSLGENGVAVLRDQTVDDNDFVAFLQGFGPLAFTKGETPLAHQPALNFVTNAGRTTAPKSSFHTDTSYVAAPPAYTALRAVEIPQEGGATVFSNQYRAYETLDREVKSRLSGKRVLHEVTGVSLGEDDERATWHPVFRRHPVSGRTALFISTPARCREIEGVGDDEAGAVIAALFAHSTDEAHCYRHAWRPGDVLMWDNRCTLHKADHSAVVGLRTLHRGMVAGEAPLMA